MKKTSLKIGAQRGALSVFFSKNNPFYTLHLTFYGGNIVVVSPLATHVNKLQVPNRVNLKSGAQRVTC